MTYNDAGGAPLPQPSLIAYTRWMYALHAASLLMFTIAVSVLFMQVDVTRESPFGGPPLIGFIASVLTLFFWVPSVLAAIMNYVRRRDVRDTWLQSHFNWQLATFWLALVGLAIFAVLGALVLLGLGWLVYVAGLAFGYRIALGWWRLENGRPTGSAGAFRSNP